MTSIRHGHLTVGDLVDQTCMFREVSREGRTRASMLASHVH